MTEDVKKQCSHCSKYKFPLEFYVNFKANDGRDHICKQCRQDIFFQSGSARKIPRQKCLTETCKKMIPVSKSVRFCNTCRKRIAQADYPEEFKFSN